jgi:cytochrome c oxidase assembly protein subunit 15
LVRVLSVVLLAGIIVQGILGGARVIEDQVQLAKIHGCFGPAVFALAAAVATITSKRWKEAARYELASVARIERLAVLTVILAYVQLVLGSQLRHLPAGASPSDFRIMLFFHLGTALALLVHAVLLAAVTYRDARTVSWLMRPAAALWVLIGVEIGLGAATWITKYGPPLWLSRFDWAASYLVVADSRPQAWITTAHVATGSLILAISLLVALRAARLVRRGTRVMTGGGVRLVETPA